MDTSRIYLDHSSTTPVDPKVLEAMNPYFLQEYGNPSSVHQRGQRAEAAVTNSRNIVADVLGCTSEEIIFTSSGTESDNLALRGAALAERERRSATHILTTPVEHDAILHTANDLAERDSFELQLLPVDSFGMVKPSDLAQAIRPETAVVSVIYGNNEIGTINPITELGTICRENGIPFHVDAVQAAGHLPLDVQKLQVDLMSISGHKIYGPKGIGVLYKRSDLEIVPLLTGGGQEFGNRAGTLNVPLIVGIAEALRIAELDREALSHRLKDIPNLIPESRSTGHLSDRLPHHASFAFHGVESNQLLTGLDLAGFACSSSSACKTGDPEPSKVLSALGLMPEWTFGSLRVTLGRANSEKDIDGLVSVLPDLIEKLRSAEAVLS
jgi:cysteine desulfurase